jgi:hypothetical protein
MVFACRLAPGEFLEVVAAGIGVGANKDDEDWHDARSQVRVGAWIEAKAGDEVTFLPAAVDCDGRDAGQPEGEEPVTPQNWWLKFIADRLSLDAPLPADEEERTRLLTRATRDLFGNAPTDDELTAFKNDATPGALDALAKRLAERSGFESFSGSLTSGSTTFKVLPVDPEAAKKPRTAKGPGQYRLGKNATFVVTRRSIGERIVNEAHLAFAPTDATKPAPREPHVVKLPDDYDSWAAAWLRDSDVLWIRKDGAVHKYDATKPNEVRESVPEVNDVPKAIRDALWNVGATENLAPPSHGDPSVEAAHRELWRRFVSPHGTLYDYTALDSKVELPTATECSESKPNALGWWTPIENGAFFGGLYLDALCNRWKALQTDEAAREARVIAGGLMKLGEAGATPGFVARGFADDGRTHWLASSSDRKFFWGPSNTASGTNKARAASSRRTPCATRSSPRGSSRSAATPRSSKPPAPT